jgi:hypothetical protein
MFVRHPMERLVSCYYDKMMTNPHKSLRAFRKAVKIRARRIMARAGHNSDFETLSSQRTKRSASEKKGKEKKIIFILNSRIFSCNVKRWSGRFELKIFVNVSDYLLQ